MKQVPDKYFDLSFTSPPYNRLRNDKYKHYQDTKKDYEQWLSLVIDELLRVSKNCIFNIQAQSYNRSDVYSLIGKYAEKIQEIIVWEKINPMPASGNAITNAYEFFLMFGDDPYKSSRTYTKNTLHTSVCGDMPKEHKAVMKYQVADYMIDTFSMGAKKVFDPFMGTGTTALVCQDKGIEWCGTEIELEYVEIANKRLAQPKQRSLF